MVKYSFASIDEEIRSKFTLKENEAIFPHPMYGEFSRSFFPLAQMDSSTEISFIISQNNIPIAWVDCSHNQEAISIFGFPLRVLWATFDENIQAKAAPAIIAKLLEIAYERKIPTLHITGDDNHHRLGPISKACLDSGGVAKLHFHAISDLSETEEKLRQGLRKSYKSLINWGEKNIELLCINNSNPDRDIFNNYINFYAKIAKKQPHNLDVWNKIFEQITSHGGELIVGYSTSCEGIIAGNITIEENGTAYYFLGAYEREIFKNPIGHWPLYSAMINAKKRGNLRYDLGEFFSNDHENTKESSIGFFKKGFTKKHVSYSSWQLTL